MLSSILMGKEKGTKVEHMLTLKKKKKVNPKLVHSRDHEMSNKPSEGLYGRAFPAADEFAYDSCQDG
jgi:hypothetical protein